MKMEDGIVMHHPDGSCFLGGVEITDSELIVIKKLVLFKKLAFFKKNEKGIYRCISMVSGVYNGLIRDAQARKEKRDNIRIDEIVEVKRKRFRLNKDAYYVTLKDGSTYIMIFDNPNSTIEYLESVISIAK